MSLSEGPPRIWSMAQKATLGREAKSPSGAPRLRPSYLFYLVSFLNSTPSPWELLNQRGRRLNRDSKMVFRTLAWSGGELRRDGRYLTSKPVPNQVNYISNSTNTTLSFQRS